MINLKEIEARCERATKGPWKASEYESLCDFPKYKEDADFISHSREDLPALLEAVKEAREIISGYVSMMDSDHKRCETCDWCKAIEVSEKWLERVEGK